MTICCPDNSRHSSFRTQRIALIETAVDQENNLKQVCGILETLVSPDPEVDYHCAVCGALAVVSG